MKILVHALAYTLGLTACFLMPPLDGDPNPNPLEQHEGVDGLSDKEVRQIETEAKARKGVQLSDKKVMRDVDKIIRKVQGDHLEKSPFVIFENQDHQTITFPAKSFSHSMATADMALMWIYFGNDSKGQIVLYRVGQQVLRDVAAGGSMVPDGKAR